MNLKQEAMKFFEMVCQNSSDYVSGIRELVYKSLEIETQDEKLVEYIKASIQNFDFNTIENEFFANLQKIINDELSRIENSLKNNEEVDYENIKNSLLEKFKTQKNININITLEDNLKELANLMINVFPMMGVSREDLLLHFKRKNEQLCNLIKEKNQELLDSLIFLTPHFIEGIKGNVNTRDDTSQQQVNQDQSSVDLNYMISDIDSKLDNMSKVDGLINACKQKYNELQRRFSYLTSGATAYVSSSKILLEKEEIRKALKQLDELIHKLYASTYATNLINRYADIQDIDFFHQKVISEIAPSSISAVNMTSTVDDIYGKQFTTDFSQYKMNEINVDEIHQKIASTSSLSELLSIKQQIENAIGNQYYDTNIRLETELAIVIDKIVSLTMRNSSKDIDPNPTPSLNAYIGESKDDVKTLVNSNNFYSVLHGIPSHSVAKCRDFIMLGFSAIMSRWKQQAELCTTFIEREKSYQDFVELYENFKDYLPLDVGSMLQANIKEMKKYIEQVRAKHTELDGVRLNSEKEQLNSQEMSSSGIKK